MARAGQYSEPALLWHLLSSVDEILYGCNVVITHENPGTVGVEIVAHTVADERHSLDLMEICMVEEVGHAQAMERRAN